MKYFGTVKAFDVDQGYGSIKPETGGDELRFERSAVRWGDATTPKAERRLSYEVGEKRQRRRLRHQPTAGLNRPLPGTLFSGPI